MAFNYSPKIATNGLTMMLDAKNPKSYPGSGTTWYDLVGSNDATLSREGIGTDVLGQMTFDSGSYDYATFAPVTLSTGSSALSVWCKSTGAYYNVWYANRATIVAGTTEFHSGLWYTYVDDVASRIDFETSNNGVYAMINNTELMSGYFHVHLQWENGESQGYINDIAQPPNTIQTMLDTTLQYIGGRVDSPEARQQGFHGDIPFVAFYDRPLTRAQITSNYQALNRRYF